MKIPYDRVVQWAAGPVAALVGWLSVQITNHVGLLGSVGFTQPQILRAQHFVHGVLSSASNVQTVGQSQIGQAIFSGLVFVASAAATYAAHHKWLSNLPLWCGPTGWSLTPTTTGSTPSAGADEVLAEIAAAEQAAATIQAKPGTPAEKVTAGLAPDPDPPNAAPSPAAVETAAPYAQAQAAASQPAPDPSPAS